MSEQYRCPLCGWVYGDPPEEAWETCPNCDAQFRHAEIIATQADEIERYRQMMEYIRDKYPPDSIAYQSADAALEGASDE